MLSVTFIPQHPSHCAFVSVCTHSSPHVHSPHRKVVHSEGCQLIAGLSLGTFAFLATLTRQADFVYHREVCGVATNVRVVVLGYVFFFTRWCLQPHLCSPGAPSFGDPLNAITSLFHVFAFSLSSSGCGGRHGPLNSDADICLPVYVTTNFSFWSSFSVLPFEPILDVRRQEELELHEFIHLLDIQNVQEFRRLAACAKR